MLVLEARVGVGLGLILGTGPGLSPGPTLEANLGIVQEPTVKAAIMMTYVAYMQKIRVSFYVPEVWLRASLECGYTAPLAPLILNRGAFYPERFAYQDVRQQPVLLMIAYTQCLQH